MVGARNHRNTVIDSHVQTHRTVTTVPELVATLLQMLQYTGARVLCARSFTLVTTV